MVLVTGGVEGIGEAVGRSFFETRRNAGQETHVYHVLPEGEEAWDYGVTFFAGSDMTERREILGRLAGLFLMVEGGPGAGHEAEVASRQGAMVIPIGRSGGYAAALYGRMSCPTSIEADTWAVLGAAGATPEETTQAAVLSVQACLKTSG